MTKMHRDAYHAVRNDKRKREDKLDIRICLGLYVIMEIGAWFSIIGAWRLLP